MQSLEVFDSEITNFLELGKNRPAIAYSKKHATHALTAAAGIYMYKLSDVKRAIELMRLCIEIQPDNPVLYANFVCALCHEENYDEALKYSTIGITLENANADMFYNHGIVCRNLGMLQDAADAFRQAVVLNPECSDMRCQLANVLLPLGQYEEGLREDEHRFSADSNLRACRSRYKKPDWNGVDLKGKKILIFNEQGHGDAIQYSRYIYNFKKLGAEVIFEIQPELYNLYVNSPYIDQLIKRSPGNTPPEETLPEHDYVVSVGSLPYYFDPKLDSIPMSVPYVFPLEIDSIDPIIDNCKKFKLGIVWAGSAYHINDKDRSCFLKYFKPLAELPDVQMFSLQQGKMQRTWTLGNTLLRSGDEKIRVVDLAEDTEGMNLIDLSCDIDDFNKTALVLKKLDLFICVDTSVAHLCGALGLPVWLLLPAAHEWRWRLNWYPTMRVFKQSKVGDWHELLLRVKEELKKIFF